MTRLDRTAAIFGTLILIGLALRELVVTGPWGVL